MLHICRCLLFMLPADLFCIRLCVRRQPYLNHLLRLKCLLLLLFECNPFFFLFFFFQFLLRLLTKFRQVPSVYQDPFFFCITDKNVEWKLMKKYYVFLYTIHVRDIHVGFQFIILYYTTAVYTHRTYTVCKVLFFLFEEGTLI